MSNDPPGRAAQLSAPDASSSRLCGRKQFTRRLTKRETEGAKKNLSLILPVLLLLVLTPSAARAQADGAGKARDVKDPARAGVITGRVVGEDGRPLADAVVQVFRVYARVFGQPLTANTDVEGRFRVPDVEPGLYGVHAVLPGYVNAQESRSPAGEEDRYYRPGDNVSVTLARGGVITGAVRDANGDPVVAISVRALRVRDAAGRIMTGGPRPFSFIPERLTDDRGVYRLYSLPAGTYLVAAGGGQRLYGAFNPYLGDAPTYFPSSPRDTANEVAVRAGEEVSGIDIRYRNERGHTVSGTVSGATEDTSTFGISVILRRPASGEFEGATTLTQDVKRGFSFGGVGDGEYEVTASQWRNERGGSVLSSMPRRVTVRGADVTGLALTLAPLASVEGRVRLEPAPAEQCQKPARNATVMETAVNARRAEKPRGQEPPTQPFYPTAGATPTEQGDFAIRNLLEGSYRLTARLPVETWYTRSITLPGATQARPAAAPKTAAAAGGPPPGVVTLKMGQTLAGVDVRIAQDGASVGGRVRAAEEGAAPHAGLKVYLVPAERERAEDVLRYSEVAPADDGAFSLTNLAPGRYKLVLRPVPETELASARPLAWDAAARARLRREAEAPAAQAVELKPCQRVTDYELRYAPAAAGKP